MSGLPVPNINFFVQYKRRKLNKISVAEPVSFRFLGGVLWEVEGFLKHKNSAYAGSPQTYVQYVQESSGEIYFNNTCNLTLTVTWMKIIMVFNKVRLN